ncbi:FAD-binding domain-containing protein [Phlegmacium glaucopus]|nr:FAD-binding domain-containing protein [Phlegmacium glaucopus]
MSSALTIALLACSAWSGLASVIDNNDRSSYCRNIPGDPGFPTNTQWAALNTTVSGRLVNVVPFVEFCTAQGGCTAQQSGSSVFRAGVPGAMNQPNWEQDFDSNPPSLCEPTSPSTCGQGDVPVFGILAESVSDIQAGVNFARTNNLRLAVKASGHDYLGRSTAKNSLLISTHKLQNSSFTDNFIVGGQSLGPAVTLGSGIPLSAMYSLTKAHGKIAVGGTASTVVPSGGYVQGGGHSALSPTLGLAADNCIELSVVIADGSLVTANSVENSDLFWALRGGGAGSWGIIVSATFKTFPTFDAAISFLSITTNTPAQMAQVAQVHAEHIFDLDALRGGQYFYISALGVFPPSLVSPALNTGVPTMVVNSYFPNASLAQAAAALQPFIDDVQKVPGVTLTQRNVLQNINDALTAADDTVGINLVVGSRLVPASAYKNATLVGQVYSQLLDAGASLILGHLVAGGQVAENANVDNAIIPAWRTAKTHMILDNTWADPATIPQVQGNLTLFRRTQLPILEQLSGPNAGAYSNEADTLEANFQTTFFGPNYPRLCAIKAKFDPTDLFIVKAGVGSERWDSDGLCKVEY